MIAFTPEENTAIWNKHHVKFEVGFMGWLTDMDGHTILMDHKGNIVFSTEVWNGDAEEYDHENMTFNDKESLLKWLLDSNTELWFQP
jgi:hypothetical protein